MSKTLVSKSADGTVPMTDDNYPGFGNFHRAELIDFPTRSRVNINLTPTLYLLPSVAGAHAGVGPITQPVIDLSFVIDISCQINRMPDPLSGTDLSTFIYESQCGGEGIFTPCMDFSFYNISSTDVIDTTLTTQSVNYGTLACNYVLQHDAVRGGWIAVCVPFFVVDGFYMFMFNPPYNGSSGSTSYLDYGQIMAGLASRQQASFTFPLIPPPAGSISHGDTSSWVGVLSGTVNITPLCEPCVALTPYTFESCCGIEPSAWSYDSGFHANSAGIDFGSTTLPINVTGLTNLEFGNPSIIQGVAALIPPGSSVGVSNSSGNVTITLPAGYVLVAPSVNALNTVREGLTVTVTDGTHTAVMTTDGGGGIPAPTMAAAFAAAGLNVVTIGTSAPLSQFAGLIAANGSCNVLQFNVWFYTDQSNVDQNLSNLIVS